ncbi:LysR substrate-binding domain-containing protein [Nevskia sp.]|uniref:LysR substrate-binding domain-containing protein n=1 Tax=Nevskia sp. TaxID=1929292 RepID=UPI0025E56263|nr:LysR substrate-binding domain-containing protein [Nevskia sp.]
MSSRLGAIEFRHLRYFTAVADARSFRAAAQQLHVSQPPLTRQIQQLEELLGVVLLERQPRGVELTAAGVVFHEEARNLLALAEQAIDRTLMASRGQLGRLDVGVYGSAVFDAIPRVIQAFRRAHPKVEVVLHNLDRAGQIKALRERRLTVGFNRFFVAEPDLVWDVVLAEALNVALPADHRLATRRRLTLADLSGEPMVVYPRAPRPGFIDQVLGLFHRRHLTAQVVQEVDDVVTAIALVSSGVGLTLASDSALNLRMPGVVYLPLEVNEAPINLCMIRRLDDDSALLRAFIDVVRTVLPPLPASEPQPR